MSPGFTTRPARTLHHVLVAALAACGPGRPGTTDSNDTSTSSGSSTSTGTGTPTTTTTGEAPAKCADAKTEAECKLATETDPALGAGCRWGEVQVFTPVDGGDGCGFEPAGGVCMLATFDEGGPACFGFWRETAMGQIEVTNWGCGSPQDDSWQGCWNITMDSPAFAACSCVNPDG